MNKKYLCFLISGTPITIQTLAEELVQCSVEEIQNIALLLEKEYGITICKKEPDQEPLQKMFKEIVSKQDQLMVLKNRKRKTKFQPPKMGKICSKPKGKKHK